MAKKTAPAASKNRISFSDNDLKKILVDSLKDIYYAEKQLHKALGKMAKAAYNPALQAAFLTHQQETEGQVQKVEEIFVMLGEKVKAIKCAAMDGLLKEANEHIEEYSKGPGRDACLIEGAQKVEHYEIAAYGTMRTFAQVLKMDDVANALQSILDQEGATDKKLTELAVSVNEEALRAHRESNND